MYKKSKQHPEQKVSNTKDVAARIGPFVPLGNPTIPIKQKAFWAHSKAELIKYLVPQCKYFPEVQSCILSNISNCVCSTWYRTPQLLRVTVYNDVTDVCFIWT